MAHEYGAYVCVDNSIMAPIFQRPIELGADISMTSATKFIAGHSDVTGGILSVVGKVSQPVSTNPSIAIGETKLYY